MFNRSTHRADRIFSGESRSKTLHTHAKPCTTPTISIYFYFDLISVGITNESG